VERPGERARGAGRILELAQSALGLQEKGEAGRARKKKKRNVGKGGAWNQDILRRDPKDWGILEMIYNCNGERLKTVFVWAAALGVSKEKENGPGN